MTVVIGVKFSTANSEYAGLSVSASYNECASMLYEVSARGAVDTRLVTRPSEERDGYESSRLTLK